MNDTLTIILSSAVIAAVVSSLIGPYFNRSQERRRSKAAVLSALMHVERSRWASKAHTYEKYISDVQELRATALVARAYRPLVEYYVQMSAVARSGSDDDFEASGEDSEFAGSVDSDVADFTTQVAEVLSDYLWHPYLARIGMKRRLTELKKKHGDLQLKYMHTQASSRIYDWERTI